jgi:hypothetical protein
MNCVSELDIRFINLILIKLLFHQQKPAAKMLYIFTASKKYNDLVLIIHNNQKAGGFLTLIKVLQMLCVIMTNYLYRQLQHLLQGLQTLSIML